MSVFLQSGKAYAAQFYAGLPGGKAIKGHLKSAMSVPVNIFFKIKGDANVFGDFITLTATSLELFNRSFTKIAQANLSEFSKLSGLFGLAHSVSFARDNVAVPVFIKNLFSNKSSKEGESKVGVVTEEKNQPVKKGPSSLTIAKEVSFAVANLTELLDYANDKNVSNFGRFIPESVGKISAVFGLILSSVELKNKIQGKDLIEREDNVTIISDKAIPKVLSIVSSLIDVSTIVGKPYLEKRTLLIMQIVSKAASIASFLFPKKSITNYQNMV